MNIKHLLHDHLLIKKAGYVHVCKCTSVYIYTYEYTDIFKDEKVVVKKKRDIKEKQPLEYEIDSESSSKFLRK